MTDRKDMDWWDKLFLLQRFAFFLNAEGNGVKKTAYSEGHYLCTHDVEQLVDDMQVEINSLRKELKELRGR